MKPKKRRKRKIKRIRLLILVIFMVIFMLIMGKMRAKKKEDFAPEEQDFAQNYQEDISTENLVIEEEEKPEIHDWRLTLVNHENVLPDDFEISLTSIDKIRKFDSRAIGELKQMMNQMKKDGITNVWVQSAYRSVEKQEDVFERRIKDYMAQGKTHEEAEMLVLQTINKPGTSEHNLGLAVDFNYVDYDFDKTAGFKWLKENAENYGFVLRYAKEKEKITKVDYEPWHWRYVGTEHAKQMNELGMCLEEYVEYLKKQS